MSKSIYLINPAENAPSHYSSEVLAAWGSDSRPMLADLNIVTIAAFVPEDWTIRLCDERVHDVDYEHGCDFVALTGKVSQRERMFELSRQFRQRGRTVIIGGPHASLDPDDVRVHADVLVRGEIEEEAPVIFGELDAGTYRSEYVCEKPDITNSPVPRWDLYPEGKGQVGQVQTSRGCPFDCEFCDVIQYLGRKQRWKAPDQVLRELDVLYRAGYRDVFLADDNFTVVRKRAAELLEAIRAWNHGKGDDSVRLMTQLSIDIARTPDLLNLAVEAGLQRCFIGIETPNELSLQETRKRQNLRVDLVSQVEKIARAGIMPVAGMIVGFDNDGPDIFQVQDSFIKQLPVPNTAVAMLTAPHATPLHDRLLKDGRIRDATKLGGAHFLRTNIIPKQMSYDQLRSGHVWLMHQIYDPVHWLERVKRYVAIAPRRSRNAGIRRLTLSEVLLARTLAAKGEKEQLVVDEFGRLVDERPDLVSDLGYCLTFYCQSRYMMEAADIWAPQDYARSAVDAVA